MGFAGSVIASFNPKTLTVTRTSGGQYVRGRYVPAPQLDADAILDGALDTVTLTPSPQIIADTVFTATNATETFTAAAHGFVTGDGPVQVSNAGGALPTGLTAATNYWIIVVTVNTFKLATSLALALAGTFLLISTDGTGVQTLADTPTTTRVNLHGLVTGDGPLQLRTTGTLPTGLSTAAYYWIIRIDANTFKLAVSYAAAIALVPVLFASDGTGTQGAVAPRTFPIIAGVQPVEGREVDYLPAGMNANETLVLYTESLLIPVMRAAGATPSREPDLVTITWLGQTEDWTVQSVQQYDIISGHYRVHVFRSEVP